jgi:hypothetical protein
MTPKEKAQYLVNKFYSLSGHIHFSKIYAKISIEEILSIDIAVPAFIVSKNKDDFNKSICSMSEYYKDVLKEIDNIKYYTK